MSKKGKKQKKFRKIKNVIGKYREIKKKDQKCIVFKFLVYHCSVSL